jgi:phage portal protein BeeE
LVQDSSKKTVSPETKKLIDKLLLEKISLAGIARVTDVSEKCLQDYVKAQYAETPQQAFVSSTKKGKIIIQCDEAWSFLGNKKNKQ